MVKHKKEDRFIKKPIYVGGIAAMRLFIKEQMQYPKAAINHNTEGSVYLRYGIDYKGKVTEVKILQGLQHGCSEEAERLVRLLQFRMPHIPRKTRVGFHKTIRIHFKVPKVTKKTTQKPIRKVTISSGQQTSPYTYVVTTKKAGTKAPSDSKKSYTYTIKY